ncbi:MAG: transposase [bacterium]|nr:transposase [bacterium]
MKLNDYGNVILEQLLWLPKQYTYMSLDEWVIMPNHIHVIVVIHDVDRRGTGRGVGTGRDLSLLPDNKTFIHRKSISSLIGAFKTTSSKRIRLMENNFRWQRSFYDHIIHGENELYNIRRYIRDNPEKG